MNKSPNLLQFVPPRLKLEVALSFKSLADVAFVAESTIVYTTFNKFITHI